MSSLLNPYIMFKGNAREAMEFYKTVFGGKLTMQTYKDFHASQNPKDDDKIMHAQLDGDAGLTLMGADETDERQNPASAEYQRSSTISLALSGDSQSELSACFQKLSAGGAVTQPLEKSPWGDTFGMCTDKYGIEWMVNITGPKA